MLFRSDQTIWLSKLDQDIGYTLVHYLYTGAYQTLKQRNILGSAERTTEYRRSVLVYCAARSYRLDGLVTHAKRTIGRFDERLSILDIAREAYPKLLGDEIWFPDYLKMKIEAAFEVDETLPKSDSSIISGRSRPLTKP